MDNNKFERVQKMTKENFEKAISFDCGYQLFNDYLKEKALYDENTVTYLVFKESDENVVMGYFTISCSSIVIESKIIKNSGKSQIPAVDITMIALNKAFRSKNFIDDDDTIKYSEELMTAAIAKIIEITDTYCGATHITVYSLDVDGVKNFYLENGFSDFLENFFKKDNHYTQGCIPLFYSML